MQEFLPEEVKTKPDFVRRYKMGEFGNCSPTWNYQKFVKGFSSILEVTYPTFGIRSNVAGGPTWYDIPHSEILNKLKEIKERGEIGSYDEIYVSAMSPHHRGTIQGNYQEQKNGDIVLEYCPADIPMRQAIEKYGFKLEKGLAALKILKHYMNDLSWEWFKELSANYPEHVIEFTCMTSPWGTVRGHNTLFWEVRKY